jgi:hypothetical protein
MVVEIPLSRGMVALVDEADYACLSRWKWHALKVQKPHGRPKFYAARSDYAAGTMVLMHREIMQAPADYKVDHRNPENTLDNRRENLRCATNMQNSWNSRKHPDAKTSRFKGVWRTPSGKWAAQICANGVKRRLGLFREEVDAATAYNFAAEEAFGEFALGNTPPRCFCCRLEMCECGTEPCWECGACGFHCTCPRGFVTCECRQIDVDVNDARNCPVHRGW